MRQPGRSGRFRPRSLGAWPRDTQVPTDLFASCRRAGTRVAATGLDQVRRMSAMSCGYQERECSPGSSSATASQKPRCRWGRFVPAHCERRSERGDGCGGGALTYRTTRASCALHGSLLARAGPDPYRHAPGAPGAQSASSRAAATRRCACQICSGRAVNCSRCCSRCFISCCHRGVSIERIVSSSSDVMSTPSRSSSSCAGMIPTGVRLPRTWPSLSRSSHSSGRRLSR